MTKKQLLTMALLKCENRTSQLAKATGVSKKTIDSWKLGTRIMSDGMVIKLCKMVNVNPTEVEDDNVNAQTEVAALRGERDAYRDMLERLTKKIDVMEASIQKLQESIQSKGGGVHSATIPVGVNQK